MLIAAIDLGTNTCNLSIAEWKNNGIEILYSEKKPVKLGQEGFPKGNITVTAIERAISVLSYYKSVINDYRVDKSILTATSGIRNVANRIEITERIKAETDYTVLTISGDDEAELIYRGIREAVPMDEKPYLLLDIGGGSNEIQIANMEKVLWRTSIDLGIARILDKFKPADPITDKEINLVNIYLNDNLQFIKSIIKEYKPQVLVGSSGSFDTFASMYIHHAGIAEVYPEARWFEIPMNYFNNIYYELTNYNRAERLNIPGMEKMRVEMIPLAAIFTSFMIKMANVNQLIRSAYALKEGVIVSVAKNLFNFKTIN